MHHRFILLVPHPENFADDLDAFHQHWHRDHAEFVYPVEQVIGYIQNRPVNNHWQWDRFHGVAELFFDSLESEEQAWESEAWVHGLAPDEHYLLDVENGWSAVVASLQTQRTGQRFDYRVLAFGGDAAQLPDGAGESAVIQLDDAPPVPGASPNVVATFAESQDEAERIAAALGGTALIARAAVLVEPPRQ